MLQSCPLHNLSFNDETVPACPMCNPRRAISQLRPEMRGSCASCGQSFDNNERRYALHSNYCHQCVRGKIGGHNSGRAMKRNDRGRDRWELLYVEMYDKQPSATELTQFKAVMVPRERIKKFIEKDEE